MIVTNSKSGRFPMSPGPAVGFGGGMIVVGSGAGAEVRVVTGAGSGREGFVSTGGSEDFVRAGGGAGRGTVLTTGSSVLVITGGAGSWMVGVGSTEGWMVDVSINGVAVRVTRMVVITGMAGLVGVSTGRGVSVFGGEESSGIPDTVGRAVKVLNECVVSIWPPLFTGFCCVGSGAEVGS